MRFHTGLYQLPVSKYKEGQAYLADRSLKNGDIFTRFHHQPTCIAKGYEHGLTRSASLVVLRLAIPYQRPRLIKLNYLVRAWPQKILVVYHRESMLGLVKRLAQLSLIVEHHRDLAHMLSANLV